MKAQVPTDEQISYCEKEVSSSVGYSGFQRCRGETQRLGKGGPHDTVHTHHQHKKYHPQNYGILK